MTLILKSGAAINATDALNLRKIQTDPNGIVLGGHESIFDFATLATTQDTLTSGDVVSDLVFEAQNAVCAGDFTGMTAAKGLPLTVATSDERLDLTDAYKLDEIGTEQSFLISAWVTIGAAETGALPPATIMGRAFQSGANHQWSFAVDSGSVLRARIRTSSSLTISLDFADFDTNDVRGAPHLLSLEARKTASGLFTANSYLDAALVSTEPGMEYPFSTPASADPPRIGQLPAYGATFDGVVHRVQMLRFDPDTFVTADWLAQEIANNSARFV